MYIGKRYESKVTVSGAKRVVCENCACAYRYPMSRTGHGAGRSPYFLDNEGARERAADKAQASAERQLERQCDAVACPRCGWFQQDMIREVRTRSMIGWTVVMAIAFCASLVWAIVTNPAGTNAAPDELRLCVLAGVLVLYVAVSAYYFLRNPNHRIARQQAGGDAGGR